MRPMKKEHKQHRVIGLGRAKESNRMICSIDEDLEWANDGTR